MVPSGLPDVSERHLEDEDYTIVLEENASEQDVLLELQLSLLTEDQRLAYCSRFRIEQDGKRCWTLG